MINRRTFLLTGTTAATASAIGGAALLGGSAEPAVAQSMEELLEAGPLKDMAQGDENAPVTIIEYASLTCPFCARFHTDVYPTIKEKFIETGKVRMIFREFPLDARAYAASMLARCADEQFYFPMTDVLYKQQANWSRAEDPRAPLLQIAKLAGFTQETFEACLQNQELLNNVNDIRKKAAEEFGVTGTPTFFINGEKYRGEVTVEAMSGAIEALL